MLIVPVIIVADRSRLSLAATVTAVGSAVVVVLMVLNMVLITKIR
jgi:hypothetical protein